MSKGGKKKTSLQGSPTSIPVESIDDLRRGVFNIVKQNIPRVREVLQGSRSWNNQQVRLYLALLNKVMPELSQSYAEQRTTHSVDEMTPDQLRAIIENEAARIASDTAITIDTITELDSSPIIEEEPAVVLPSPILAEPK